MKRVLLASTSDPASVNIRDNLLDLGGWKEVGKFDDSPVWERGDALLLTKRGLHLEFDLVDREIADHITLELPGREASGQYELDLLVFLSKHSSEMKIDSLTVHSPGNYGQAQFGGRSSALPPSAPRFISAALRSLYKVKKEFGLRDRATFETTHHGPYIDSPSFFIEIGSEEPRWKDRYLGEVIARSLLGWDTASPPGDVPISIGIGGGHYAPRFSDVAIQGKTDFGHMVPDYALTSLPEACGKMALAAQATPGVKCVHFHPTPKNSGILPELESEASRIGLSVIS